jgi:PAS domain S-box-containing protein
VNKNRNIVQCNQKFSEIVGYSISELIGESTKIFHINEQTYKIFGNQYYSKLRNGSLNNVTYKFKRKDGKLRDCSISGNLIDSTNFDEGVIWVITDITQQMEIQRIIKYSEKKFRDLTENLSEIILILDDKLNIQFASSAIKKFLEIDPEQVKGLNFMTFVDDDDHDDLAEGFDTVIDNSDQVFNIDLKLVSRSHKKRFFECGISNMKNNRAVAGIVVTAHDITDRMDIQSKVNHMVSELEMKNLDLNFLNKELNDANATKDKFFSIIAHDLKSPFNTMVGFADLLLEDYYEFDDAERYSMVGKIYNSSMNALRLLENLLEWSQMQRGKMDYNPQKIDLYILSKQVLEQISSSAQNKHISIELSLPQNSWARIDKYMIAVVIRNLISNAIKFTPKNGSIKIRLQNKDSDYLLSVSDTGTGMTAEQIANLFFIESNVSTSGTEGEVGTGLGLILCKEFIDKHEGEIWAESQPGKGSTFYFTVPVY